MFDVKNIYMLNVTIEPKNSGSRTFLDSSLFDVKELHNILNDGHMVGFINNTSKWSNSTEKQIFLLTDKVTPSEGYDDAYVFTHYGRGRSGVVNRKIIMNFKNDGTMLAEYFSS